MPLPVFDHFASIIALYGLFLGFVQDTENHAIFLEHLIFIIWLNFLHCIFDLDMLFESIPRFLLFFPFPLLVIIGQEKKIENTFES
jgi:hypothetical protein